MLLKLTFNLFIGWVFKGGDSKKLDENGALWCFSLLLLGGIEENFEALRLSIFEFKKGFLRSSYSWVDG